MLPATSSERCNRHTENKPYWKPGSAPVAVVMISLNEAHNMEGVVQNLKGWAHEVCLPGRPRAPSLSSSEMLGARGLPGRQLQCHRCCCCLPGRRRPFS